MLNPLEEFGPPPPRTDASVADVALDEDAETCRTERWPPRPTTEDGTGPDTQLVFALEELAIGGPGADAGGRVTSGFDLDGVCTCPGPPSCVRPTGVKEGCDNDGGIDSAGTDLLAAFVKLADLDFETNRRILDGERGLLFRVRFYNGGLDDAQVEAAIFLTSGTEPASDGGPPRRPARDGTDRWTVDPESLYGKTGPPYVPLFVDQNAYVAKGTLVAKFDFPLKVSDLTVNLSGGVATARLVRQGSTYRLDDGRVVGRWATRDLLTALDAVRDPFGDGGICGESELYKQLKKDVCATVDIAADPALDTTSAPCNALSMTVLFTAGPAQLGALLPREPPKRRCGDAWADECPR